MVQRSKLGRVDFEGVPAELGPRLFLSHSDAAYWRVGEHDGGDVLVLGQRSRLAVEESVRQLPTYGREEHRLEQ